MQIGSRIRNLRKSKKITLKELSKASGVALATLSRIETNKMTGTLKSHQDIASSLGVSLSQLYSDMELAHKPAEFQSFKDGTDFFVHNDKASYYILTNNALSKKMMPLILKIAPAGKTAPEELPKQTEKFVYILKGRCKVSVGSDSFFLNKGETLYFDASKQHHFRNIGREEVHAICIISPPAL